MEPRSNPNEDKLFKYLMSIPYDTTLYNDKILIFNYNHFDEDTEYVIDHMVVVVPCRVFNKLKLINSSVSISFDDGLDSPSVVIMAGKFFDKNYDGIVNHHMTFPNDLSWLDRVNNWKTYDDCLSSFFRIIKDYPSFIMEPLDAMRCINIIDYPLHEKIRYVTRI